MRQGPYVNDTEKALNSHVKGKGTYTVVWKRGSMTRKRDLRKQRLPKETGSFVSSHPPFFDFRTLSLWRTYVVNQTRETDDDDDGADDDDDKNSHTHRSCTCSQTCNSLPRQTSSLARFLPISGVWCICSGKTTESDGRPPFRWTLRSGLLADATYAAAPAAPAGRSSSDER